MSIMDYVYALDPLPKKHRAIYGVILLLTADTVRVRGFCRIIEPAPP